MRHIKFDESLVMREFARIAGEKGIIKQAQDPAATLPGPGVIETGYTGESGKYAPVAPADPASLSKKLSGLSGAGAKLLGDVLTTGGSGIPANVRDAQTILYTSVQALDQLADKAKTEMEFKADAKTLRDALAGFINSKFPGQVNANQALSGFDRSVENLSASLNNDGMVSTAAREDKLYNITGETGEDLINSAHPGNTRTDVSNSKTNENLIETVVEQQERDIAMVNKKPTGKYAELKKLHSKLVSLGENDMAEKVSTAMGKCDVADVVAGELEILANYLDAAGHKKYAAQLKKKFIKVADQPPVQIMEVGNYAESAKKLKDAYVKEFKFRLGTVQPAKTDELVGAVQSLPETSMNAVMTGVKAAVQKIMPTVDSRRTAQMFAQSYQNVTAQYSNEIAAERKSTTPKPMTVPGLTVQVAPQAAKPEDWRSKLSPRARAYYENAINKIRGMLALNPGPFDGKLAQALNFIKVPWKGRKASAILEDVKSWYDSQTTPVAEKQKLEQPRPQLVDKLKQMVDRKWNAALPNLGRVLRNAIPEDWAKLSNSDVRAFVIEWFPKLRAAYTKHHNDAFSQGEEPASPEEFVSVWAKENMAK